MKWELNIYLCNNMTFPKKSHYFGPLLLALMTLSQSEYHIHMGNFVFPEDLYSEVL